ncbi:MAG: hypothetical protein IPO22_08645 [Anaerolineales bacterium]|nr:hypothetical protein [Anaerolineales bacterium]
MPNRTDHVMKMVIENHLRYLGGVTLICAAAKNHERVSLLVCDPGDYNEILSAVEEAGEIPFTSPLQENPLGLGVKGLSILRTQL